jgi:catechol 2,3-dioxygenase-like lactoylglutathione lyase family enzyme
MSHSRKVVTERDSRSYGDLPLFDASSPVKPIGRHTKWTLADVSPRGQPPSVRLPLASFNHIAREVLSLEKSRRFYVDILGFAVVPRPPFDCEGYWLYGYGLSLHLVATSVPDERKVAKVHRIKHFTSSLPRVDHIAFISTDIEGVKTALDTARVYYMEDMPKQTGIHQIFLFDPDGNVIEISNCSPEVGQIKCNLEKREIIRAVRSRESLSGLDAEAEAGDGQEEEVESLDEFEGLEQEGEYKLESESVDSLELGLPRDYQQMRSLGMEPEDTDDWLHSGLRMLSEKTASVDISDNLLRGGLSVRGGDTPARRGFRDDNKGVELARDGDGTAADSSVTPDHGH